MAYFGKEQKQIVAPLVNAIFKKYGVKGTIRVRNHSQVVITVRSGQLDFLGAETRVQREMSQKRKFISYSVRDYFSISCGSIRDYRECGENTFADFFQELMRAAKSAGWYDRSDIQVDYFDVAYYIDIQIGSYNQPYKLVY